MRTPSDFSIVITADGSPSLSVADPTGYVEKMHHAGGALAESLYIYGAALKATLERRWPLRVLSLGLGLGYNEVICSAFAVKSSIEPKDAALFSFETEPVLSDGFVSWLKGEESAFQSLYEEILNRTSQALEVPSASLKDWLCLARAAGTWRIRGAFPDDLSETSRMTCVLYDAYSNKMNSELWDEEFLVRTIGQLADTGCVFATYAATGSLNRALRRLEFQKMKKHGFAGKRESTFAVRE